MKRDFYNSKISQRTQDGFFNATELKDLHNKLTSQNKAIPEFWSNKGVQDFIIELQKDESVNIGNSLQLGNGVYETKKGKYGGTWMHPYLFVKFAMWLSPQFELQIIKWVYDNLIEYRNYAGDNFKEMCSTICEAYEHVKGDKPSPLIYQSEAKYLNLLVYDNFQGGKRNELSEKELDLLNQLQKFNIQLIKSRNYTFVQRRSKLMEYAQNYKLINF